MEKTELNTNKQYFIVSLDNGIREEEPVSVEIFNSFSDGSKLVQLNKKVFGVYKYNGKDSKNEYLDDFDLIKSDIAELLDIDHEETRRMVTEEANFGTFTELNYSKDIETRISATAVLSHLVGYYNKGMINSAGTEWVSETLKLPVSDKGNPIKDPKTIENLINIGLYALIKDIEYQTGKKLDNARIDALQKAYIRMILFDYLIGRKYRGVDYYLISGISSSGKPIYTDVRLAPLSVSTSLENENSMADNEYCINNRAVDREVLLDVIFEKYYKLIKKMTEALNDANRLYKDAISRIIYNNTDLNKAIELEDTILDNLLKLNNRQQAKEKQLNKEQKTNKVERTMATQSLNVKVTTKLDLIQKKYPINPKDHPDLIKATKGKKDKDKNDDVKLVIEEMNKKSGFVSIALIVSIIALVYGLGIGIAYVIITMGSWKSFLFIA